MIRKRDSESFSIAFLDVMSCGFGAIILLLMITKTSEPIPIEITAIPSAGAVNELQRQLFDIRGETTTLNRELNAKHEQLSTYKDSIARLRRELTNIEGQFQTSTQRSEENSLEMGKLSISKQSLTEEMQRLLGEDFRSDKGNVGGIPVDSEYIIFVVDTSGSMQQYSWNKMLEVMVETLDVYPKVKGIQVMSDMGDYLFPSYRGKWMIDSPSIRNTIIRSLASWSTFSNSSPVEGITRAIRTYYDPNKKISIYVFGDDFLQGGSIREVIRTIDRINVEDRDGNRLVRIHAVGFPVLLQDGLIDRRYRQSVRNFSNLMRQVTQRNGGTFVALNEVN